MDSLPIVIPPPPASPQRPPVPFIAALVPVAAGIALWFVTGSILSLCFAALGPLMIFASLIDGARARRRLRRAAETEFESSWVDIESELVRRHDEERERRWHRRPDAAVCIAQPPLRGADSVDTTTDIVVGRASVSSGLHASGGDGDRAREFQRRCSALSDAPVTVPLGGGVAIRGAAPIAVAAARALVVQLCMRFSPTQVALVGEGAREWGVDAFPHAQDRKSAPFRVGLGTGGTSRVAAETQIIVLDHGDEVPEGLTTVLDITEPCRATLRTPHGISNVYAEGVSREQAAVVAESQASLHDEIQGVPDSLLLHDLPQSASAGGLPATIGRGGQGDVVLDIVEDGPHAIVTGTTGTGKSELLVSWVTAIAAAHGPDRVTFVLADFKGGTAFDPLRSLPHVAAVITDLDELEARRGVSSLSAELRRRESVLANAGVRDVRQVAMPRLIIVIDEFAALLQEHADLGAIFTDIAARGRALGMHLIIGTQRASGVIRDALASNCPLRVSLRVSDPSDSRLVIGTNEAAEIPGGATSRGLALARRPQDDAPVAMRVALTRAADLRNVGTRWSTARAQQSPWLPPLPALLPLDELVAEAPPGSLVLGRGDEPEYQRQPLEVISVGRDRGLAVVGASGSGRTAVLRALGRQHSDALWVPDDPETAWDAVTALAEQVDTVSGLVMCDDIDAQINGLPAEYAQHLAQRWEQLLRSASNVTFVISASRASGAVGRLLDALPRRALLRLPTRVEHLAAGGDASGFDKARTPGRARIGDREVQIAWVADDTAPGHQRGTSGNGEAAPAWQPRAAISAVVTTGARTVSAAIAEAYPQCDVRLAPAESSMTVEVTRPTIMVAEADVWQRSWALWQRIRREGEVLIRAENVADLRQLAGVREIPPFARLHAGRAWSLIGDGAANRVVIPALMPQTFHSERGA